MNTGPVPTSTVDFWRMVWQEKVPSIVMITNLMEGKKIKCEQYWPKSGSQDFGPFQVTITQQLTLADYSIRTLSLQVYIYMYVWYDMWYYSKKLSSEELICILIYANYQLSDIVATHTT